MALLKLMVGVLKNILAYAMSYLGTTAGAGCLTINATVSNEINCPLLDLIKILERSFTWVN